MRENARTLAVFYTVEVELARLVGSWIARTPELPEKLTLARVLYEDADHARLLGQRLLELRVPESRLETLRRRTAPIFQARARRRSGRVSLGTVRRREAEAGRGLPSPSGCRPALRGRAERALDRTDPGRGAGPPRRGAGAARRAADGDAGGGRSGPVGSRPRGRRSRQGRLPGTSRRDSFRRFGRRR